MKIPGPEGRLAAFRRDERDGRAAIRRDAFGSRPFVLSGEERTMGFLGKLFGTEKERLPLDPSSAAARRIERDHVALDAFARKVHDKLELVPGERAVYAFIGRPPDAFGIAWIEDGEEHNFKRLMKEKGLSELQVKQRSEELRAAYGRSAEEPRYTTDVGGKHVLVTPSATLERELVEIIHRVAD
jgi:hypothetical protein